MKRTVFTRAVLILLGLLIVCAFIGLISAIGRAIFGGPDSTETNMAREALLTNTAEMSVEMSVRGPIVADESFTTVVMNISSSSRETVRYNGYSLYEADRIELTNTPKAYEEFVYSLDKAGFATKNDKAATVDTRGVCATGKLYEFRIKKGDRVVQELWTSTCKGEQGNLKSNMSPIYNLFIAQNPGSTKILAQK